MHVSVCMCMRVCFKKSAIKTIHYSQNRRKTLSATHWDRERERVKKGRLVHAEKFSPRKRYNFLDCEHTKRNVKKLE
jgi:hypothetical protein